MRNILKIEAQTGPWGLRFAILGIGYWYLDFALLTTSESSKSLRILGHLMETIFIPYSDYFQALAVLLFLLLTSHLSSYRQPLPLFLEALTLKESTHLVQLQRPSAFICILAPSTLLISLPLVLALCSQAQRAHHQHRNHSCRDLLSDLLNVYPLYHRLDEVPSTCSQAPSLLSPSNKCRFNILTLPVVCLPPVAHEFHEGGRSVYRSMSASLISVMVPAMLNFLLMFTANLTEHIQVLLGQMPSQVSLCILKMENQEKTELLGSLVWEILLYKANTK